MHSVLLRYLSLPRKLLTTSREVRIKLVDVVPLNIHSKIWFHKNIVLQHWCQAYLQQSYCILYQDTILHCRMLLRNLRSRIVYISAIILFQDIFQTFMTLHYVPYTYNIMHIFRLRWYLQHLPTAIIEQSARKHKNKVVTLTKVVDV